MLQMQVDTSEPVIITDTIKATPVSRGIARGVAKVCMNVEEASKFLQPGDILITHGTDIAWSPFFPILGEKQRLPPLKIRDNFNVLLLILFINIVTI